MKRLAILLLSLLLFLEGCSSSSPSSAPAPKTEPSVEESKEPEPSALALSSFDDGTVSCSYDSTLLKTKNFDSSSGLDYLWVVTQINDDEMTAYTNGNCIYIATSNQGFDSENGFEKYPKDITQTLFNAMFQQEGSSSASEVIEQADGSFEYSLSLPECTYKGKILSSTPSSFSVIVYRIYNDADSTIRNAFDSCYESIAYISAAPSSLKEEEDPFAELNRRAEEEAASAKEITEGSSYDSIVAVYQNVTLQATEDTLFVNIKLSHESCETDSVNFFDILTSICQSCKLENDYSNLSFSLIVDDNFVAMLSFINYTSPSNFSSSEPVVLTDEYKEPISTLYSSLFSQNDISNSFDEKLDSLKEQYGITE